MSRPLVETKILVELTRMNSLYDSRSPKSKHWHRSSSRLEIYQFWCLLTDVHRAEADAKQEELRMMVGCAFHANVPCYILTRVLEE